MAKNNATVADYRPVQGKVFLETKLYKFALALENLSPNTPLDLRGFTLFRKAIKDRLITKAQLGSADPPPRGQFKSALYFTVPREYERKLRIFLTPQATSDINTILRQIFIEMANSHIRRAVKTRMCTAQNATLEFLNLYGLTEDDFDMDTLTKSEYRLRLLRQQENVHEMKRDLLHQEE